MTFQKVFFTPVLTRNLCSKQRIISKYSPLAHAIRNGLGKIDKSILWQIRILFLELLDPGAGLLNQAGVVFHEQGPMTLAKSGYVNQPLTDQRNISRQLPIVCEHLRARGELIQKRNNAFHQ